MTDMLWDMHIHLDFFRDARETAREAEALGLGLFAASVTPQEYEESSKILSGAPNVRTAVGLHPWWIADGRCGENDVSRVTELLRNTRYAGEIGLDASPKHVPPDSLDRQKSAFEKICRACALTSTPDAPKILSIHSVKSAGLVLDILAGAGCLANCRCIFHWFTGSNEDLTRAVRSGCMFSVNGMMLGTRRGREYARQIPADRLLLETDLPPGRDVPMTAREILDNLESTLEELRLIRGADMRAVICGNSARLLCH